jgi:hypothetical protein
VEAKPGTRFRKEFGPKRVMIELLCACTSGSARSVCYDNENVDDNVSTKCVKKHSVLFVCSCPFVYSCPFVCSCPFPS